MYVLSTVLGCFILVSSWWFVISCFGILYSGLEQVYKTLASKTITFLISSFIPNSNLVKICLYFHNSNFNIILQKFCIFLSFCLICLCLNTFFFLVINITFLEIYVNIFTTTYHFATFFLFFLITAFTFLEKTSHIAILKHFEQQKQ